MAEKYQNILTAAAIFLGRFILLNKGVKMSDYQSLLQPYLDPDLVIDWQQEEIPTFEIPNLTPGIKANSYYFGHPEWAKAYFECCHRDDAFKGCWRAAMGSWDDKIVVDIGCGPGNLYASLGGSPRLLIGVDVSLGSLKMAQKIGYTPVLADAQHLPFVSGFADIVTLNAALHHCDDMAQTLKEAARLVRPGGLLITDHDPQISAGELKGIGQLFAKMQDKLDRITRRRHVTQEELKWMWETEVHHKKGDGVTQEFFYDTLEPLGFKVHVYPHNHRVGGEVLQGNYGRSYWQFYLAQILSGMNPHLPESALSLMCVAIKK
jgi:ubiquinone/menaquinone biosynthesis C-methylase UbiE